MIIKTMTFDTETTGLNPLNSFIISIGCNVISVPFSDENHMDIEAVKNGKVDRDEFYQVLNWFEINENFSIPEDTIKVHGITEDAMKAEGIHPVKVFCNMYDFMDPDGKYIMADGEVTEPPMNIINAFNLSYDMNMMKSNLLFLVEWMRRDLEENGNKPGVVDSINLVKLETLLGWFTKTEDEPLKNPILFVDSMTLDKILHFEVDGVKVRHNLAEVGKRCGIPEDPNAHNALADTRRLTDIWMVQLQDMNEKGMLPVTQRLEARLISKYKRDQDKWKKKGKQELDYLGESMTAAKMSW